MSEEVCEFGPGIKAEYYGNILKVSDLARIRQDPTDEVTMVIDTTHLSETEIHSVLELAESAFKGIRGKYHHKEEIILNDSSVDSVKFFREVLKIKELPMMKINLAASGRLIVKNRGLNSALELLDAKVRDRQHYLFRYPSLVSVDCYDFDVFIFPGVDPCSHKNLDFDNVTREGMEKIFQIEDILQIVSFATKENSSDTLENYLSSDKCDLGVSAHKISAFAIRTLAKLAETSRSEIELLTSDQLRELISLVELSELGSHSIEDLLVRLRLPRITWPYRPHPCQYCIVPFYTLDEINRLDSESKKLNLAIDKQVFSVHLHNAFDFLFIDVAIRKGVPRYIEFSSFTTAFRESIIDFELHAPSVFKREFEKYLMGLSVETLKSENDDIPIAWIVEMSENQHADELLSNSFFS
jgi:hypothetical protein